MTKMLDLVHKTLHQMTFAVQPVIISRGLLTVRARWDNRCGTLFEQDLAKVIGIVASIGNQIFTLKIRDQAFSLRDVVTLPTRQRKSQRIAQRVHRHMDFGGETAPAAPQCLRGLPTVFSDAPAAQGCARTVVLSIIKASISGSLAKWANICSQMPSTHHREKRLYTAFQSPYSAGNNRHCAPLRAIQSVPSTKRRHFPSLPIRIPQHFRRNARTFFQCSLGSLTVLMPPLYAYGLYRPDR